MLPKQMPESVANIPDEFAFVTEENVVPPLTGETYATDSVAKGMEVCVYNEEGDVAPGDDRPWCGRAVDVFPESGEFLIHWYKVS